VINILYIIASLEKGGAEGQLFQLVNGLNRQRYRPLVCCIWSKGHYAEELDKQGVPVFLLKRKSKYDIRIVPQIVRIIKSNDIKIVHTYMFTANLWGRLAAIVSQVPFIIISERCVDWWKSMLHRWIDRFLARFTTRIIANSEAVKKYIVVDENILKPVVDVIYNGVDASKFAPRDKAVSSPLVIGNLSRFNPQKNILGLLRAIKLLRDQGCSVTLLLLGDAQIKEDIEYKKQIIEYIRSNKLEQAVEMPGKVIDVPSYLERMDLVVQASHYEGFPNVLMEAMSSGKLVIATKAGGTAELTL
jgi:glycosyltransferase involved in cell wall biosynthesis